MTRLLLSALLLMGLSVASLAQREVSGTVIDPDGEAVIGATVVLDGTSTGTTTDLEGKYDLTVPEEGGTLTVSYIGYEPMKIELTDRSVYNVEMAEGVALDEVVVTGYSVGTQREATGAISTISTDKLQAIPSGNVEQQLQGRASGVTVITNGQPGTESKVRIRGFGSFNDNRPLYIVDGVPTNNIGFLPPDQIESTSILKDAASASIYGARASGGVIVYRTKRGNRNSGLQVSYDGLFGITDPGTGNDVLSPQQQAEVIYQARRNDIYLRGGNPDTATITHPVYDFSDPDDIRIPDYIQVGSEGARFGELTDEEIASYNTDASAGDIFLIQQANRQGTDWYDRITRRASLQRHGLGFSGGTERSRFYAGLNYQDQEGILLNNRFKRYVFRGNSEFDVVPDRLRVGENLQFTYSSNVGQTGASGGQGIAQQESEILAAFRIAPIVPARTVIDGEELGYGGTAAGGSNFGNSRNPLANLEARENNTNNNLSVFGNVYAELDIIDGLYVRTLFGGNYGYFNGRNYGRATYENSENIGNNSYSEFNGNFGSWVWTNTLNFDFTFADQHNVKGLVGYEANQLDYFYSTNASGINPFNFTPEFASIATVNSPQVSSGFGTQRTFASSFGQINYNYGGKYYLTGVLRRDESSAFGANNRSGVFPAISGAWRITGEGFAAPNKVLSDLKLRAGYGIMGNSNAVSVRNQFNFFGQGVNSTAYDINGINNGGIPLGFAQNQIANPDARWEESTTTNVGVEATFFDTKLDVTLDLWQKKNEGVLFPLALPNVNGSAAAPFVNVATIDNQGIDLELTYRDVRGDFGWEATLTGSFLNNEIIEVAETVEFFESACGTRLEGCVVRNEVGFPISTFFGYEVDRLYQPGDFQQDSEGNFLIADDGSLVLADGQPAQAGAAPGRFRFADINGTDEGEIVAGADGAITPADRTQIGDPVPDFTGGINLRLTYKQFDVETFIYASYGNEIFNVGRWYTDYLASFTEGSAKSTRLLDAWSPTNTGSSIPIAETSSSFSTNSQVHSYYIEDGSYLRMRLLTLGYNLPPTAFDGAFSRARVFLSANNVFTITDYTGLDPAVGGAADTDFGIDVGNYPITRSFQVGIGLGF